MALTMSRTPTFVGCGPSYIRVVPDTLASLPTIDFDHIAHPDGTISHTPKVTARVRPSLHAASMATINLNAPGSQAGLCNGDDAAIQYGHKPERWCFRGIRFKAVHPVISQTGLNIETSAYPMIMCEDPTYMGSIGPKPFSPDRIILNQCYIDGNTGNYGQGLAKIAQVSMTYFGMVNSWADGTWDGTRDGNQTELFLIGGDGKGPVQIENNYLPIPGDNIWITGGSSASAYPDQPSIIARRNDCPVPWPWRQSEVMMADAFVNPAGFTFQVGGGGLLLTKTAGWAPAGSLPYGFQRNNFQGPIVGSYIYDPATGVARRVSAIVWDYFTGYTGPITLAAPWPLADGQSFTGYIQMPSPAVLYQSGLTGALAHTTAGSRTVTLDTALPLTSPDGLRDITARLYVESGPFFYTNDTVNRGDCGGVMAKSNNWGRGFSSTNQNTGNPYMPGIAAPWCWPRYDPAIGRPWQSGDTWNANACRRRVEIEAISPDRKTLTLASPYFETTDFTFSIVVCDGLDRLLAAGGKGPMEVKCVDRGLIEGNVTDFMVPTTVHPQANDGFFTATFSVIGDQVTLLGGPTWPSSWSQITRAWQTFGGQDPLLSRRPSMPKVVLFAGGANGVAQGRYFKSIDSPTTATLWPIDPRFGGRDVIPTGTVTLNAGLMTAAHWSTRHVIARYNLCRQLNIGGMGSVLLGGHGENWAETDASGPDALSVHDNLCVQGGPVEHMMGLAGDDKGMAIAHWLNFPIDIAPVGPGIGPLDGDFTNSYTRVSHNAVVRTAPRGSHSMFNAAGLASQGQCHHFECADNIADQWSSLFGGPYGPSTDAQVATYFTAPFTIARNILIRAEAPAGVVSNVGTTAPDNVGVAAASAVGFHDYSATIADPPDPANWALDDIYTTGTVTIAANGLSATLPSGTFPSTVVPGQFFTTDRVKFYRITSGGAGTATVAWTNPAHPDVNQSKTYAITFKGTATDGTDPGPNIALLKQFTDGVRMLP